MNTQFYEGSTFATTYNLAEQLNSKCIKSISANTHKNLFIFGTNSLKKQNQVHLFEYDDENQKIKGAHIFNHPGIVNQIFPHPEKETLLFTSYQEFNGVYENNKFSICQLNSTEGLFKEEYLKLNANHHPQIKQNYVQESLYPIHSIVYLPKSEKVLLCDEQQIQNFDMNKLYKTPLFEQQNEQNLVNTLTDIDPHHPNLIANINGRDIQFYDIRDNKLSYKIKNTHDLNITDLDFNPNKQYQIITSGEDSQIKFWDIRKSNLPVKTIDDLQNWILSCKYNRYHDQLILSSCDDGSVNLHRVLSTSSAQVLSKFDNQYSSGAIQAYGKDDDALVKTYEEQEDSVYSIAWSANSAWIFATISYQGNVIVNLVPSQEKYRILL